jgi:hypothetical protein
MTDAPERIWLQTAGEWAGASEVTWCEMPMNDGDHEYRRSDAPPTLAEAMTVPEVARAIDAMEWALPILKRVLRHPNDEGSVAEFEAIRALEGGKP